MILLLTRKQIKRRLSAPQAWLNSVIKQLPWGAALVNDRSQILLHNDPFVQLLGLARGDRLPGALAETAGRVAASGNHEVASISTGGGKMQHVQAIPIRDNLNTLGVLLLLSKAEGQTDESARLRELLGTLSHELRTPLTAIIGHIDILESCGPEEEQLRQRSQRFIASEAARLSSLVDELSRLTRLQSRAFSLSPVNPRSVAEEALSAVYKKAETKGVNILLQSPPDLPRVSADADALQQVLINLLDNAVKYTPPSSSVTLALATHEGGVEFAVSDEGPGISPQDQPHLFAPFFRSSRSDLRKASGVGLGLTIVKSILDKHGSEMRVQSEPGKGARFSFILKSSSA